MILCIRDGRKAPRFLEWSSIVDAPTTHGMTRAEMLRYLRREHGEARFTENTRRVDRAEKTGTSGIESDQSAEDVARFNRAGPEELSLTFGAVVRAYVRGERLDFPASAKAIHALRSWECGPRNVLDGIEPYLLFAVEPAGNKVRVEVQCNTGDARTEFTLDVADTAATTRAKCEAAKAAIRKAAE